jgi:phosphoribosylglycinamide formyltransferase-1
MSRAPLRVAVLISGTGSNLKVLIDAAEAGLELDFRVVVSNRADAPGLEFARQAGIPVRIYSVREAGSRAAQEQQVAACLQESGAELVVLAGYMLILGPGLVGQFAGRMINLHPSLLPLYPGLDTYGQVLGSTDKEHGSSIHFVTAELDGGPLISQVRIPVYPGDTAGELARRLGPNEHRLMIATIELFVARRVKLDSEKVLLDGVSLQEPLLLNAENHFD